MSQLQAITELDTAMPTRPLDDIPPEVRIRIFKEVLRAPYPLLIARKAFPDEFRFNVSLLTASKSIYAEASDVFFEVNPIRLWRRGELKAAIKKRLRCIYFLRHLELVNITNNHWVPIDKKGSSGLAGILKTCSAFPKLKTLTIAYDVLKTSLLPYLKSQRITKAVTCVDVGLFQLEHAPFDVFFKHYGMVRSWHLVKADTVDHIYAIERESLKWALVDHNGFAHGPAYVGRAIRTTDLPCWCALYDGWRRKQGNDEGMVYSTSQLARESLVLRMFGGELLSAGDGPVLHPALDKNVRLRDLDAAQHSLEIMEWLSELWASPRMQSRFTNLIRL